ncbi:MAG: DUF4173 domain-containing protein [Bacteroidota bacterium]|nr:DUF4173 domain-containing protein [Bacteroidota bacterium]
MKKSDWVLASATLLYSYLFYKQLAGINFFIFSILIAFAYAILNKDVLKNKMWLLVAGLSVTTSFFIMWHNSNLAIWANLCSLMLLSGYSLSKNSSVLLNGFYSIYSIGGSYVFIILNTIKRSQNKEQKEKDLTETGKGIKFLIGAIVFILILSFFFIYKSANPLFEKYTEKINLDFISGRWILFTLGGFLMIYGLLKQQRINMLDEWESKLAVQLTDTGKVSKKFEKTSGTLLFMMLNLMLVFINALDIIFLYAGDKLPEGITHSQFVHNGVGMLILSIVLGVSVILYIFRNALHFDAGNKVIKLLISLWILQNIFMIVSASVRNYMYVLDYSLTYKRIGVFVYLALTVIGLLTVLAKIHYKKSNWYLVRSNAFCGVLFLCFSSFINWDKVVCEFNITCKTEKLQELDKKYLLGLSDESIPYLQSLKNQKGFDTDSAKKDLYRGSGDFESLSAWDYVNDYIKNSDETDTKTYNFLKKINTYADWQSWNKRNSKVLSQLKQLNTDSKIKTLSIKNQDLDSLGLLSLFNNATEVNLNGSRALLDGPFGQGNKFAFLASFKNVNSLDVSFMNIKYISSIPSLPTVKNLNINNNNITELAELSRFKNVENLVLSNNSMSTLNSIPVELPVKSIELNNCIYLTDLNALSRLKNLETVYLDHASQIEKFPRISSLRYLSLNSQPSFCNNNLTQIPATENLETLSLCGNENIQLINLLIYNSQSKTYSLRFPNLKELLLSNNLMEYGENLKNYKQLHTLNISSNHFKNISFLSEFEELEKLDISGNYLDTLSFNENHKSIKSLDISSNGYLNSYNALKHLTNLEYLNISATRFSSLSQLSCSGSLKELNISNCRLNSLKELAPFKKLERLTITGLNETDIEHLKKLSSLKILTIYASAGLAKEVKEKLKKQLPNVKIELL